MPHPLGSGIKRWCCLMSVANIGPKSRTQKPRKTKIGTEVAHGHHFQGQKVKVQGHRGGVLYCGSLPLSSLSYCMYVKRVCLQHSSRTAGKTKAIMEWVFVLCSCRFRMNSVPCSVHGFMFHLLRNHQQWQHDIYRQDAAKWQTAGIKFNHRPKIRFFCPAGATCSIDSRQIWHGRRAPGYIWLCKISPQRRRGWECGSQNISEFPLFGKAASQGWTPWPISKIFTCFYTPKYHTLVFQSWKWFASQVTELLLRNRTSVN